MRYHNSPPDPNDPTDMMCAFLRRANQERVHRRFDDAWLHEYSPTQRDEVIGLLRQYVQRETQWAKNRLRHARFLADFVETLARQERSDGGPS